MAMRLVPGDVIALRRCEVGEPFRQTFHRHAVGFRPGWSQGCCQSRSSRIIVGEVRSGDRPRDPRCCSPGPRPCPRPEGGRSLAGPRAVEEGATHLSGSEKPRGSGVLPSERRDKDLERLEKLDRNQLLGIGRASSPRRWSEGGVANFADVDGVVPVVHGTGRGRACKGEGHNAHPYPLVGYARTPSPGT